MTAVANPDLSLNSSAWERGGLEALAQLQMYSNNPYNFSVFNESHAESGSTSSSSTSMHSKMKPADVHLMLARAIQRRKSVLFAQPGRGTTTVTQQMKEEEWESLRKEMVANGVTRFERKTWQTVRDVDFQQIRRKALHRQTLAQQGNGAMPETEFDIIMMDILSSNQNDSRYGTMELKTENNGGSPFGNDSDRYTESPQANGDQANAIQSLLSSLINSQADQFAQLAAAAVHPDDHARPNLDKQSTASVSAAQTDTSSANSVHANEPSHSPPAHASAQAAPAGLDALRSEILHAELRTQQNLEKAAQNQLQKSEVELELARLRLQKFKRDAGLQPAPATLVLDDEDEDNDEEPEPKRARTEL